MIKVDNFEVYVGHEETGPSIYGHSGSSDNPDEWVMLRYNKESGLEIGWQLNHKECCYTLFRKLPVEVVHTLIQSIQLYDEQTRIPLPQ